MIACLTLGSDLSARPMDCFSRVMDERQKTAPPLDGIAILLVEDEALLGLDLQATLEEAGATVIGPIASATKAAETALNSSYEAAILDLDLQGHSGLPVATIIAQRDIPFLFHTAYGEELQGVGAFRNVPVCSKPIDPDELVKVIVGLLAKGCGS